MEMNSMQDGIWEFIRSQPNALMIALLTPTFQEIRDEILKKSLKGIARQSVDALDSNTWEYSDGCWEGDSSYEMWIDMCLKPEHIPVESLISKAGVDLCLLRDGRLTLELTAEYKNAPTCSNYENHNALINILQNAKFDGVNYTYGTAFWRIEPFSRDVFDSMTAQGIVALAMESQIYSYSTLFSVIPLNIVSTLQCICTEYANILHKNNYICNI